MAREPSKPLKLTVVFGAHSLSASYDQNNMEA